MILGEFLTDQICENCVLGDLFVTSIFCEQYLNDSYTQ